MQRPATLENQERSCRELAAEKGWEVIDQFIFTDAAISGTSMVGRKGLDAMLAAVKMLPRPIDYLLVDDTSRLSRDLGDVLELTKTLKFYGVDVYFVSQRLDSRDEASFRMILSVYGIIDEQYVTGLRTKIRSSVKGRVLAGYNCGSNPYGYRGVVEQSETPNAIGRAATKGTRLEVIESEAVIIRRIFLQYANRDSMMRICRQLNLENVPWPHCYHGKWGVDAVKRILHNEKYRGIMVWNMSSQPKNPQTGQAVKRLKPSQEHVRVDAPHLRIVSDQLWDRVASRLKELNEKNVGRLLGGFNRAKDRQYPYSGLLFCGVCGSRMKIDGKHGSSMYTCPNHRVRRGCTNAFRIREDRAADQITDALTTQLLVPETMNYLVSAVFTELTEALKQQKHELSEDGVQELERAYREGTKKVEHLIDAIENSGLESLSTRLRVLESEQKRLEDKLKAQRNARTVKVALADVQALVERSVTTLLDVLKTDVALARQVLQDHVKKLMLYPSEFGGKPVFEVVGELDLFSPPSDPNDGVLLGVWGTLTAQQHTMDRCFRFTLRIVLDEDSSCHLLEPFCRLLEANPGLSLEPRTPSDWAKLLNELIPDGPSKPKRFTWAVITRCLWFHRAILESRLKIIKTANTTNPGHLYQLSLR
jgi:DNA invertase Pin-like site-specific DNA recombinase